ncbi:MAG: HPr family phosphocarrier protein [Deltaproteobacteria bacterium]|nr:HPr family phosphocarrier protein [Deltaproteobacteria bacterium]
MDTVQQIAPGEYETTVVITNELGLHARPAALVAKTAQRFSAEVTLHADDKRVDAKSILDILSLAAGKGTSLIVRGKGHDAEECLKTIADLIRVQFQEESA